MLSICEESLPRFYNPIIFNTFKIIAWIKLVDQTMDFCGSIFVKVEKIPLFLFSVAFMNINTSFEDVNYQLLSGMML